MTHPKETITNLAETLRQLDASNEYVAEYDSLISEAKVEAKEWYEDLDHDFFIWELSRELRKIVRILRTWGESR